jgi:HPt (histidine-containing phosphotransfer) domain-containing protein
VAELAGVFLEDARSGLQEVKEALQEGDASAVERVAHKLRGGSGSVGTRGMVGLCANWDAGGGAGERARTLLLEQITEEVGGVERAPEAEVHANRG